VAINALRIPIDNLLLGSDYTGKFYIGAKQREVNLLLDTGSSTIAIESRGYDPQDDANATVTDLAQEVGYGDGSGWVGSVVRTNVTAKSATQNVDLPAVAVAVAYQETADMFGQAQGILGLAYEKLDTAYDLGMPTVPPNYTPNDFRAGLTTQIEPYFTQLEEAGLVAGKYAFYTKRSVVRASADPAADPLNHGWLILGGGEEEADLYSGEFQEAAVLSDDWYSVNLKSVTVGESAPIPVSPPTFQDDVPTNAIVDSGTNGLLLALPLYNAIMAKLPAALRQQAKRGQTSNANLDLAQWPTLTFILQGTGADVRLVVKPENYWQLDAGEVGTAVCMLWKGTKVGNRPNPQSILGLPLMNGYFTIFDDTANHGLGSLKFAAIK
jgi:hypothetical protein